jgi:hypothetical protein
MPTGTDQDTDDDDAAAPANVDYHSTLVGTFQKRPFRGVMAVWQGTHINIYDRRARCDDSPVGRAIHIAAFPWPDNKTVTFVKLTGQLSSPKDRVDLNNEKLTVNGKPAYWGNYAIGTQLNGPTRFGFEWTVFEEFAGTATYGKRPTRESPSTISLNATTSSGSVSGKIDVHVCR